MPVLPSKIANATRATLAWTEVFAQNALLVVTRKHTVRKLAHCVTKTSTALLWLKFQVHPALLAQATRRLLEAVTILSYVFA
jgi:hypothetical protein